MQIDPPAAPSKKDATGSLDINPVVVSALLSPYRLWSNPFAAASGTCINDEDWRTLHKVSGRACDKHSVEFVFPLRLRIPSALPLLHHINNFV